MKLPKYCKANQIRFKRKRLSKKKKQQADKQKVTKRHVGIVAKRFARIETGEKPVYLPKAEAMAFAILETCCLNESHRLIPVPDLKATNSFSRISDSGDLLRISSRLIQIWYKIT